jgi:predicted small lipoprotein YifL
VINGKFYLAGGDDGTDFPTDYLDVYDPATNTWKTKASMPEPRLEMASAVIAAQGRRQAPLERPPSARRAPERQHQGNREQRQIRTSPGVGLRLSPHNRPGKVGQHREHKRQRGKTNERFHQIVHVAPSEA